VNSHWTCRRFGLLQPLGVRLGDLVGDCFRVVGDKTAPAVSAIGPHAHWRPTGRCRSPLVGAVCVERAGRRPSEVADVSIILPRATRAVSWYWIAAPRGRRSARVRLDRALARGVDAKDWRPACQPGAGAALRANRRVVLSRRVAARPPIGEVLRARPVADGGLGGGEMDSRPS
jgi:hypothetical protein